MNDLELKLQEALATIAVQRERIEQLEAANTNIAPSNGTLYKLFRQYMVNDAGITTTDLKNWIESYIQKAIDRVLSQIDVAEIINRRIVRCVEEAVKAEGRAAWDRKLRDQNVTITLTQREE